MTCSLQVQIWIESNPHGKHSNVKRQSSHADPAETINSAAMRIHHLCTNITMEMHTWKRQKNIEFVGFSQHNKIRGSIWHAEKYSFNHFRLTPGSMAASARQCTRIHHWPLSTTIIIEKGNHVIGVAPDGGSLEVLVLLWNANPGVALLEA